MLAGIFDGETFGNRGVIEGLVGGDQCHGIHPHRLTQPIDFKESGKLHGIVGPEAVGTGEQHGSRHELRSQFQDIVTPRQMAAEMAKNGSGLRWRKASSTLTPGYGGKDFNCGDVADKKQGRGFGVGQRAHPFATRFIDMPFNKGTCIEKVCRHLNDARG